jgi:hypothetical protein
MSTTLPTTPRKKQNRHWLWLTGGAAFLISLLPFLPFLLLPRLVARTPLAGWITWVNLIPYHPLRLILLSCLPIALSIFTMLLWRRSVKRNSHFTARRGMLTFLLADILAALTLCLLLTITVGLPAYLINTGMIAWAFFWLLMCLLATAQSLYSLPFLLITGAIIGKLQGQFQDAEE